MAKPYPVELRERAVAAVIVEELSQPEAARLFGVGLASLERWLARWRLGASLEPKQGKPGPAPLLDEVACERLEAQRLAEPDARLRDQARAWKEATGQVLSETTIWRVLRARHLTRKKSTSSTPGAMKKSVAFGEKNTRA